ncbi:MAG TPA: hypothetical protein VKE30_00800 [Chthoniobacterales bacterium]|nr:hypothetical protein [Chthoniobacterales bacterium]
MKALVICIAVALTFSNTIRAQENAASQTPTPSDSAAAAAEIPKGYEICENERTHRRVAGLPEVEENEKAISPDGRFAMICPLRDTADANDKYPPNLLVRLKPYAVLAKLNKEGVRSNANLEINATWEDNSTVAIWEYYRWGIVDLTIYEIDNDKVKRVHRVMNEARKIFERDIRSRLLKKYPKESATVIVTSGENKSSKQPDFKFDGRKLLVYLEADNKPNLAPGATWGAELDAVWNLDTGKFEKVHLHPEEIGFRKPEE